MEFEWDPLKEAFNAGAEAFYDPMAVDDLDEDHSSPSERRFGLIGRASTKLLFVVYTLRGHDIIRLISARRATAGERMIYEQANSKG